MLRWADRTDAPAAPLIDGVPTVPRAASLLGTVLLLAPTVIPIRVMALPAAGVAARVTQIVLVVAATSVGLLLLLYRRRATASAVLFGLALLDLSPIVLIFTTADPAGQRSLLIWLVVPTVIAATHRRREVWLTQTVVASTLAAATVLVTTADDEPRALLGAVYVAAVLIMAVVVVHRLADSTRAGTAQLWRTSLTDGLTGVLNRRGLISGFPELVRTAIRTHGRLGVLVMDVDHFKTINDEYGHALGDRVLTELSGLTAEVIGDGGLVARTGGEELAVVVIGSATQAAERLRSAIRDGRLPVPVTVSIGTVEVAPAEPAEDDALLWNLLDAADRALYRAKQEGRDRVCTGTFEQSGSRAADLLPPPAAAVPAPTGPASSRDAELYGIGTIVFSAIALLCGFLTGMYRPDSPATVVVLVGSTAGVAVGIWLIVRRPIIPTTLLLVGALIADGLILATMLAADDLPGRRMALFVAIIPALLVSLYLTRPIVLAHHIVVVVLVMIAAVSPGVTPPLYGAAVLSAAAILVGSAEMMYRLRRRHDVIAASLHAWSVTDPLTGAANRRGLELAFSELDRDRPQRVLALDVDDFKAVNDRRGHLAGDDALARFTLALRVVSPAGSIIARTGGDEFVVVHTGYDDGTAERVRGAAAVLPVPLSVTVGEVQSVPGSDTDIWDLVTLADMQLTELKQVKRGRLPSGPTG